MDLQIALEYIWVLFILIGLEGLLAADNALILAIMVKNLKEDLRKKALFYGLLGAFVLRFASLFIISFLIDFWQIQLLGALYLLTISSRYLYNYWRPKEKQHLSQIEIKKEAKFWPTVIKIEFVDLAFALDSILAAIALAQALPPTGWGEIGNIDKGQFYVVLVGGLIGVVLMRFAANLFVQLLEKRPGLEVAAFFIVGWVGFKLLLMTLAHEKLAIVPSFWMDSTIWKVTFYAVLVLIVISGWFSSKPENKNSPT